MPHPLTFTDAVLVTLLVCRKDPHLTSIKEQFQINEQTIAELRSGRHDPAVFSTALDIAWSLSPSWAAMIEYGIYSPADNDNDQTDDEDN